MTVESGFAVSGSVRAVPGAARLPRDLRRLAAHAERLAKRPVRLEIAFVTDPEIARLNRRWLNHKGATDVISFPLLEGARRGVRRSSGPRGSGKSPLLGALAVSTETARREAEIRGAPAYHELLLYVVHGVLHLLGFDDKTAGKRVRMRRAETKALGVLGLPSVYARRPKGAREGL